MLAMSSSPKDPGRLLEPPASSLGDACDCWAIVAGAEARDCCCDCEGGGSDCCCCAAALCPLVAELLLLLLVPAVAAASFAAAAFSSWAFSCEAKEDGGA